MTTKDKINEAINTLESTAKACEISTVAEIKNNLKSAISNLQAVEAETASGDNLLRQRIAKLITETESQKYYPTPLAAFVFALKDVLYSTPADEPAELAEWKANELREQNKMLAAAIEQSKQAVARLNAATDTLEAQKTATSDGNTPTQTNTDKALFLFRRISALKAEKAKCSEEMGAKWFNSTLADEYGNAIYAALEEIEKLA